MAAEPAMSIVEPDLLWRWVAARSIARGQPLPVPDRGGMRVDTGLPEEMRRYVFASPGPGLRELAAAIDTPHVYLKVCAGAVELEGLLPPRWQLQPAGYLMAHDGPPVPVVPPSPGYRVELLRDGALSAARILAADGTIAASGHAVEHDGVFILDRILTHPDHRRHGLGRALVTGLGSMQRSPAAQRILAATEDGRALYTALGWRVLSPYSTLVIAAQQ